MGGLEQLVMAEPADGAALLVGVEVIEVENVPEGKDAERVMENMGQRQRLRVGRALLDQGVDVLGVIVDSPITVLQTAEKRGAYSVGYHYLGVRKFAPKGWISGIAFTWGDLYTRFAREVMDGTWKSRDILGNLADDFLTVAPFGEAVPADAAKTVDAKKADFLAGKAQVFQGPTSGRWTGSSRG